MGRISKFILPSGLFARSFLAPVPDRRQDIGQRSQRLRHYWRQLLLLGLATSLFLHGLILLILSTIYRWSPSQGDSMPVVYEFAILEEEELTRPQETTFDDLDTEGVTGLEVAPEASADLLRNIPEVELDFAPIRIMSPLRSSASNEAFADAVPIPDAVDSGEDTGDVMQPLGPSDSSEDSADDTPSPGGSESSEAGDGNGDGEADGAGTSFFGISSSGMKIAYIVDISGSMNGLSKGDRAMRELSRSINRLPDHAEFFVILFSDHLSLPPFQVGWMKANETNIRRVERWLENDVKLWGGTEPFRAFQMIFEFEDQIGGRPDVLFFLTDGKIKGLKAKDIAALNDKGKNVVINTIAFGESSSKRLLQKIASDSGGEYRFVSSARRSFPDE